MKILVVGSGGREHAIADAVSRDEAAHELFTSPGNAGTAEVGQNVDVAADDLIGLCDFASEKEVDLVIVGPEVPLVMGLADRLQDMGISVFGPTESAARLEGSKAFAKDFMERHGIPTAPFRTFTRDQMKEAEAFIRKEGAPIVVKASGLAAGKGAVVCTNEAEAIGVAGKVVCENMLGSAGDTIVIERFMEGEEASVFAVADGNDYVLLHTAQDHKRIGDGDTGPNTGGMGAYAPAPLVDERLLDEIRIRIIEPTLEGMASDGCPYTGVLYAGLMITADGPKVVEFNCRMGDPEAQVVLPLLDSHAVDLFAATAEGRLGGHRVRLSPSSAACVVMASEGYPGSYEKGRQIRGLTEARSLDDTIVYLAGVNRLSGGEYVTSGGRVLGVTGKGEELSDALDRAYAGVSAIDFDGGVYRSDIGRKGLARLAAG